MCSTAPTQYQGIRMITRSPIPGPGQSLSPWLQRRTITPWDNPHTTMKFQSLIPTLAVPAFAATASAQSAPSAGDSFAGMHGTAGSSGTVNIASPGMAIATSTRPNAPPHPSFWNRLTGRKGAETRGTAFRPVHNRSWFGLHHNAPAAQTRTTRVSTTASKRSNGWHMPFFSRR